MIKPFIWMFKTENFKEHILYLFFTFFKLLIPGLICLCASYFLMNINTIACIITGLIGILLLLSIALCIQGYFWDLTESIIHREFDIKAASIYNGKIDCIETIQLPEINTLKFIWRGFASWVASILMWVPFMLVLFISAVLPFLTGSYDSFDFNRFDMHNLLCVGYALLIMIAYIMIPALLWNYAKQDSVVAVWNIRKAIYLMGNYPFRYIKHATLYTGAYGINTIILNALPIVLGIGALVNSQNPLAFVFMILWGFVSYILFMYSLYVYAFILGTLAPPGEG